MIYSVSIICNPFSIIANYFFYVLLNFRMTLYFLRNDKVLLQPTKLWKDFLKDVLGILKQDKIVYKNEDVHYRLESKNPETLEIQQSY